MGFSFEEIIGSTFSFSSEAVECARAFAFYIQRAPPLGKV
jgi:hypothetical protein